MSEKDKLRGIIAEMVRAEIEAMMREAKEEVGEVIRSEFFPQLRAVIREAITKELESVAREVEGEEEEKGEKWQFHQRK